MVLCFTAGLKAPGVQRRSGKPARATHLLAVATGGVEPFAAAPAEMSASERAIVRTRMLRSYRRVDVRVRAHGIYPPQDFARRCEVPTTQTTTAARKRPRR